MEIVPADSLLFRAAVDALKEFLPEATLQITPTGVVICGMDRSHIGFVYYNLNKADCKVLKVPAPQTIGMNMNNLSRVLSYVGSGDSIKITLNKAGDRLVVQTHNEKIGKKAVYELALMEIREDGVDLPELTYSAKVVAKTSDIVSVIKEVGTFGDSIALTLNGSGFHIAATGDMGSAKQTLENTDDREMELTETRVSATFATKYLSVIMKGGAALSSTITLEFDGAAAPLRASFNYGASSQFIAYQAPKVTND